MPKLILFVCTFLAFYLSVWAQPKNKKKYLADQVATDSFNVPLNSSAYYFPISMFINTGERNKRLSIHLDNWYSRILFALNEPLLYNHTADKEEYRFTWLRRFKNPVCVRVEKTQEKIILHIKVSNGDAHAYPGRIIVNHTKEITPEQWNLFKSKLDIIHFWTQPTEEVTETENENSEWILEGSTAESYHFMTRTSPRNYAHKFFRDCCEYLLQLGEYTTVTREKTE
jgi:hypothetical protein